MDTVWLLQDDSDYYGPDFEAVFATEEAAREYMAAMDEDRRYSFWQLDEVPLYDAPPRVFTVYSIVLLRRGAARAWPREARVATYTRSEAHGHDPNDYPSVVSEPHLVRVEALFEDEAKQLFADEMRRRTKDEA